MKFDRFIKLSLSPIRPILVWLSLLCCQFRVSTFFHSLSSSLIKMGSKRKCFRQFFLSFSHVFFIKRSVEGWRKKGLADFKRRERDIHDHDDVRDRNFMVLCCVQMSIPQSLRWLFSSAGWNIWHAESTFISYNDLMLSTL